MIYSHYFYIYNDIYIFFLWINLLNRKYIIYWIIIYFFNFIFFKIISLLNLFEYIYKLIILKKKEK